MKDNLEKIIFKLKRVKRNIIILLRKIGLVLEKTQDMFFQIYQERKWIVFAIILGLYLLPILFSAGIYFGVALIPALILFPVSFMANYSLSKYPLEFAINNSEIEINKDKLNSNIFLTIIFLQIMSLFLPRLPFDFGAVLSSDLTQYTYDNYKVLITPSVVDIVRIFNRAIYIQFFIYWISIRDLKNLNKVKTFMSSYLIVWLLMELFILILLKLLRIIIMTGLINLFF